MTGVRPKWDGMAPCGKHGADFRGQPCTVCPRCTCVDNQWACEQHNPKANRSENPLHFYVAATGNLCGLSGRSGTTALPEYISLARREPHSVCPACALRTTALAAQQERDHADGQREYERVVSAANEIKPEKFDPVNKPAHYNAGGVECIVALEAATVTLTGIEAVCAANAIKYLWRHNEKNGVEDLKKAKWYIDRLIAARTARGAK